MIATGRLERRLRVEIACYSVRFPLSAHNRIRYDSTRWLLKLHRYPFLSSLLLSRQVESGFRGKGSVVMSRDIFNTQVFGNYAMKKGSGRQMMGGCVLASDGFGIY